MRTPFIHLGFNEDESKRKDRLGQCAMPHIAGRQMPMNVRFGLPDGAADPYEVGSEGVLWWSDFTDTMRHRKSAGMLDRCGATHTCPKIIETFGSTEFWALRMSPDLVGPLAEQDIPVPDNVRRYYFPGTTHGGGPGGFTTAVTPPARGRAGICVLPSNPNPESDTLRALLGSMVDWIVKGLRLHRSRASITRLADGTLVHATKAAVGFPDIPGIAFRDKI